MPEIYLEPYCGGVWNIGPDRRVGLLLLGVFGRFALLLFESWVFLYLLVLVF
jgi:hypothetical protein